MGIKFFVSGILILTVWSDSGRCAELQNATASKDLLNKSLTETELGKTLSYPDQRLPGTSKTTVQGKTRTLQNNLVSFRFDVADGKLKDVCFEIKGEAAARVIVDEAFVLVVNGKQIAASAMKLAAEIREEAIPANPASPRLGDHSPAKSFMLTFTAPDNSYRVVWKPLLRDDANYVLFDISVEASAENLVLNRLTLLDVMAEKLRPAGVDTGSPVVNDRFFFGCHYPTAIYQIKGNQLDVYWERSNQAVPKGDSVNMRSVIGIYPAAGQLRRAFNYYLNRERAQAYHQVLHYNAWYDILHTSRKKKADEAEALERIETFTNELTIKRGVPVKSFMFDDPWDNVSGTATDVWQFDPKRNPNEWKVMKMSAEKHGSALGVWISPQGGWGGSKARLQTAIDHKLPYRIENNTFSLADPAYLARFREVCFDFLRNQGVNMFKFDGFNEKPNNQSEREALVKLIEDMREEKPDLFINTTIGSWHTPFFLMQSDSIWRGGGDVELRGIGPVRQQWLTYRDWQVYIRVAHRNSLFPISSLMIMGPVLAPYVHHEGFDTVTTEEWKQEVRSYFANGSNLQELYIGPDHPDTGKALMNDELWDIVAEGAKWAKTNEDVLLDTHWVGGNPGEQQVYGMAAWNLTKATLMLRNPSDKPQSIVIDPEKVFELPQHEKVRTFVMKSPWADEAHQPAVSLTAGEIHTFQLEPFEVIVLERK